MEPQRCQKAFFCSPQMWRMNMAIRHIVKIELFYIKICNKHIPGQLLLVSSKFFYQKSVNWILKNLILSKT